MGRSRGNEKGTVSKFVDMIGYDIVYLHHGRRKQLIRV